MRCDLARVSGHADIRRGRVSSTRRDAIVRQQADRSIRDSELAQRPQPTHFSVRQWSGRPRITPSQSIAPVGQTSREGSPRKLCEGPHPGLGVRLASLSSIHGASSQPRQVAVPCRAIRRTETQVLPRWGVKRIASWISKHELAPQPPLSGAGASCCDGAQHQTLRKPFRWQSCPSSIDTDSVTARIASSPKVRRSSTPILKPKAAWISSIKVDISPRSFGIW